MGQRDFNKDMGSYLNKRHTSGGIISRIKDSMPRVVVEGEPEQAPAENVSQEEVERVLRGEPAEVLDKFDDEDDFRDGTPRERSWKRFFSWIWTESPDLIAEPEEDSLAILEEPRKEAVDEDVKEMLRICIRWINRLPPEEIQDVRRSDDYRQFKVMLDRYGLIKK